jgi:spore germination cell wall hydrolase CwlJ-like protein
MRNYVHSEPVCPEGLEIEIPGDTFEQNVTDVLMDVPPESEEDGIFEEILGSDAVILPLPEAPPEQGEDAVPETEMPEIHTEQVTKPPAQTQKPVQTQKPAQTQKPQSKPVTGWSVTYEQAKGMVKADSAYDYEDLYWLSRIISAEAKGESFVGQIGVGTVVLNRARSGQYPNSIKGVVFDRKHGTQFTPVANGTIYDAPTKSAVVAAKMCLDGYLLSDSVLFFVNPRIATSSWIQSNRKFAFRVGNHDFYY